MKYLKFPYLILNLATLSVANALVTESDRTTGLSVADELSSFSLPEGFTIELIASEENGLINPIDLTFDEAGRLWTQTALMYPFDSIGDMSWSDLMKLMENPELKKNYPQFEEFKAYYQLKVKGEDKILVIDNPTEPVKGEISVFADGLTIPQSILPYKDGAFVAHGSEMLFLDDTDQDGFFDKHETVLTGFGFNDTHTMSHSLVRGPGGWIHFSQGALNEGEVTAVVSGVKKQIAYSKAAKFSLDGKKLEITNSAGNNMWGFQLRENGQWFATEANDRGFCVTPFDPFMSVQGIGNKSQREYQPWLPKMHDFSVGGTGLSGLAFDENGAEGFPEEWENVAFIANPLTNAINAVFFERHADGSVTSKHLPDFLTSTDKWFRPVNIEFGPDGALYIADWYNQIIAHNETPRSDPRRDRKHGRIWKISHQSQKKRAIPNLTTVPTSDLVHHLSAEILWEKRSAWQQIADRQAEDLIPAIRNLVTDTDATVSTRIHALWSLESLGCFEFALWERLLSEAPLDVQVQAIRALSSLEVGATELVSLLSPLIEHEHHRVRGQVLRTIYDVSVSGVELAEILVTASKPELGGLDLGGPYERSYERFLARMAMEKHNEALMEYVKTAACERQPLANQLWALLALPEESQREQFLKLWSKIQEQGIDDKTFVLIMSMVDKPDVFEVLRPYVQDEANRAEFLDKVTRLYADLKRPSQVLDKYLTHVPMVYPDNLLSLVSREVEALYSMGDIAKQRLAVQLADRYGLSVLNQQISSELLTRGIEDPTFYSQGLTLLARQPQEYAGLISQLAVNESLSVAQSLSALMSVYKAKGGDAKLLRDAKEVLLLSKSQDSLGKEIEQLKMNYVGLEILYELYEAKKVDETVFDRASVALLMKNRAYLNKPGVQKLSRVINARYECSQKDYAQKIEHYTEAFHALEGNAQTGQGLFQLCLACHQVGGVGQEIAPPLDGSSTRDLESLLTAIVNPDAAIEAGYFEYIIATNDGDILKGYMDKKTESGTTIALLGGQKIYTPKSNIRYEFPLIGKSFMPKHFGSLPDQTMVDLVTYIKSLK